MNQLFPNYPANPELPDANIVLLPEWLPNNKADHYFQTLSQGLAWEQQRIKLFGKEVDCPRLSAWYGDSDARYSYSGLQLSPKIWTAELAVLRDEVTTAVANELDSPIQAFNSVLANLYRNEKDSMGWHSDNEPELGPLPVIASLSLGEERRFSLKHKTSGQLVHLDLPHGSLLIMAGTTQSFWKHSVPKRPQPHASRINLTFRRIISANYC